MTTRAPFPPPPDWPRALDAQAIILAAGASTRMGGHPKALTDLGGRAALERLVDACEAAGIQSPLVVLGAHFEQVRAALPHLDARVLWVRNPRPDEGRTGTLQRGLTNARAQTVLVLPVDHPLVAAETLRVLLAAPGAWVTPERAGRGGHPIKLADVGIAAVQSAPPHVPLREIPGMMGLEVARVPVDDPGIHLNLDRPEDVAEALQYLGRA